MKKKKNQKKIKTNAYIIYGVSLPDEILKMIQPWIGYELFYNVYHRKTVNINPRFLPPKLREINHQTINRNRRFEGERSQFIINCILDFLDVLHQYRKISFPITNSLAEFIRYSLIFRKFIRFTALNRFKIGKEDGFVNQHLENYLKERGLKIMRDA